METFPRETVPVPSTFLSAVQAAVCGETSASLPIQGSRDTASKKPTWMRHSASQWGECQGTEGVHGPATESAARQETSCGPWYLTVLLGPDAIDGFHPCPQTCRNSDTAMVGFIISSSSRPAEFMLVGDQRTKAWWAGWPESPGTAGFARASEAG